MGIKDLFEKNAGVLTKTSLEEEVVRNSPELESEENIKEQRKRIERFIPHADYSKPQTFARYGSAESYYKDAVTRVYNQYPYDGSEREIQEFLNDSNYIDLHILDHYYPRTTGYAIFSADGWGSLQGSMTSGWGSSSAQEYISIKGGPHTASGGAIGEELRKSFGEPVYRTSPNANIYEVDVYGTAGVDDYNRVGSRESNLKYKLANGSSVEFWLKKSEWITSLTEKEVIFDLWNGQPTGAASAADDGSYYANPKYGRLLIYLTGSGGGAVTKGADPMRIHFASGSSVVDASVLSSTYTTSSISDGLWHHYAITLHSMSANDPTYIKGGSNLEMKSYVDGELVKRAATDTPFGEVQESLNAYIGALQTSPSGNAFTDGGLSLATYGKLSASMDEFRYWKGKRTERDIQRNWWTQVRGGTNTDLSNTELGVYYKFNEGIVGTEDTDKIVLDYSGRISNGVWVGYPSSNARSTGSAINAASGTVSGTVEFKDPIIYSEHADVTSVYNKFVDTGSAHDHSNVSSIMDSMPAWIVEEDDAKGSGELKKLTQIIGSYFDTLHLQIEHLPKIQEVGYPSSSNKPIPFSDRLLSSFGFHAPETFVESSILEKFANRRDDREYGLDINDVKNQIYQNIYNNLIFMYKSKGTEKAFRNLVRCYGIDDEVIKLNAYGNNSTFKFEDTHYDTTIRKNYIDFNHPNRFAGTVYQNSSSNPETTGVTYLSGTQTTTSSFANTAEVEVIFPKKLDFSNTNHFMTPFISSSIFGCHTPKNSETNFSWPAAASDYGFQVYAVRTKQESTDAYFLLKSRTEDFTLSSSVFNNVYDNQKWNFAVRIKDGKYPYVAGVSGSNFADNTTGGKAAEDAAAAAKNVVLEFIGHNVELGVTRNQFAVSASNLVDDYLSAHRRYYCGADRTNTTGSLVSNSDLKISSVRHWAHYLEDDALLAHARDPDNVGVLHANRNVIFAANDANLGADNVDIPEIVSLAFHWDFSQVTGSDASGQFVVDDASSGSVELRNRYSSGGNFSQVVANMYAGRGKFTIATGSSKIVDKNYVPAAKQRLPEVVNSGDAVNVLRQDDDLFPSDPAVSQTFFAFEKSMYGVISQEMINMFATIVEFNNLVGELTNKYREGYKDFDRLRLLFFEKIQNDPDLDKFIDYYKWVDNSLSVMIQQLVPASADVADEIRTVVESHILERSKYRHKIPLLDYKGNARWGGDDLTLQSSARGISELSYNWKHGHAPVTNVEKTNALWWKERAERSKDKFVDGSGKFTTLLANSRQAINDVMLSFNSSSYGMKFANESGVLYAGSTYALRQFASPVRMSVDLGGSDKVIKSGYNFPRGHKPQAVANIVKPGSNSELKITAGDFRDIDLEEQGVNLANRRKFENVTTNKETKARVFSPIAPYSSSADNSADSPSSLGYRTDTENQMEFAGYHVDAYGENYEVPMQGPFAEAHVGGYQHRHIDLTINPSLTGTETRPDAWAVEGGDTFTTRSSMHNPTAYASYRRDEFAKRPVNIRNIQSTTGSSVLGNYYKVYEVVQATNRRGNNNAFIQNEGFGTSSITSVEFAEATDYAKPNRGRTEHVFVNRFSAPGGPETAGDAQGGPFLDLETAEYSPYNNINYRNLTVRKPLRDLLTEPNAQFGYRSGSSVDGTTAATTVAAIYKVNRNPLKRLVTDNDGVGPTATVETGSTFDNYYVQHAIPRSDYQYTWITASTDLTSSQGVPGVTVYGYFPAGGMVSSSEGLVSAVRFVSASDLGTSFNPGPRRPNDQKVGTGVVLTDFAGMNTTIVSPISASSFSIGYPLKGLKPHRRRVDVRHYYNYADIGEFEENTVNTDSFITKLSLDAASKDLEIAFSLNHILLHRNGPYGYPTWKQLRVGQGQLARHYRNNNLYTNTPIGGEATTINVLGGTRTIRNRRGKTLMITQSVITTRYRPIKQELLVATGEGRGKQIVKPMMIQSSYANNIVYFDDPKFTNNLGIKTKRGFSAYDQVKKLYLEGALDDPSSPVVGINRVIYSEAVYPSLKNAHTIKVRGRTDYKQNFWRDSRTDRTLLAISASATTGYKKSKNIVSFKVDQSSWALDGRENWATEAQPSQSAGTSSANNPGRNIGQLQNEYVHFHSGNVQEVQAGVLYARKHIFPATRSIAPSWGMPRHTDGLWTQGAGVEVMNTGAIGRGDAIWEAGSQAGRYSGTSSIFVTRPTAPFHDSYKEYFSDIKSKGKDYSIIPEFRITDHLRFYREQGNNFLADNPALFSIAQSTSGSSIPQNSDENRFFRVFSNSDFLKHFEIIRNDHKDVLEPHTLTLKCNAIKKFLPYNGFYPAERTVEVAKQFYDSYSDGFSIVDTGGTFAASGGAGGEYADLDASISDAKALHRNFLKPLFAPGILFNTIKAGLAVDYPIMNSNQFLRSAQWQTNNESLSPVTEGMFIHSASFAVMSNSSYPSRNGGQHHSGWDARIPFEALIAPTKHLSNLVIADDEPSDLCRANANVIWSGEGDSVYREMMHNFLAESVGFFIKGGKTTGITSRPEKRFESVQPGRPYGMRIKLWRTMDGGKKANGDWGDFVLPQNTRETSLSTAFGFGGKTLPVGQDITPRETFTMYSRPSAFGPPLGLLSASGPGSSGINPVFSGSLHDWGTRNGVYASHTPPYYDGESWIDLIFWPKGMSSVANDGDANVSSHFFALDSGSGKSSDHSPYRPTLAEIFSEPSRQVLYSSASNVPLNGTFIRKWRYDREELQRTLAGGDATASAESPASGGTYGLHGDTKYGPSCGPWMNIWAMQGDASMNIFDSVRRNENDLRWRIQTKFETPMLNFNHVGTGSSTFTEAAYRPASCVASRGMWHQFGRLPLANTGVYMQVTDIPSRWLDNHPSANVGFDLAGDLVSALKSERVSGQGGLSREWKGYTVPIGKGRARGKMGSLVDVCGFSTDPVRIGEVANKRMVSEAIVAVPFVIEEGEKRFFSIPDPRESANQGLVGRSVAEQFRKMKNYVFPPTLDFITNPEVSPIAMYIFEFKHRFNKDDLSHMWQNLMPRLGKRAEVASSIVSHNLLKNELMGDWQEMRDSSTSRNAFAGENALGGMPDNVRWMVFKVKQKARRNYFESLRGNEDKVESVNENLPNYGPNWPYDFFSMVELAQLEAEVEFGNKEISPAEARLARDSENVPTPGQRGQRAGSGGRGRGGATGRRQGRQGRRGGRGRQEDQGGED